MADENKTTPTLSGAAADAVTALFEAEDTQTAAEPLEGAAARALAQALAAEAAGEGGPPAKKRRGLWWIAVAAVAVIVAGALVITSVQYRSRFLPHTELWGIDVSSLPLAEATERLTAAASEVQVVLREGETEIVSLPLTAFAAAETLSDQVRDVFFDQHQSAGALAWLGRGARVYAPAILTELSPGATRDTLEAALYGGAPPVQPRDAYIELGDTGYTLVPEEEGNLVDLPRCVDALTAALEGTDSLVPRELAAEGEDLRILPKITAENRRLRRRCEAMDAYLATPVTLDFQNGNVYTLTREDIWSVSDMTWTVTSVRCTPDRERVAALADRLATEYASDGVYAKFKNVVPTRELIYYRVGDNGWILDRETLGRDVFRALSGREGGTVVPDYDYTWYWNSYYGCGDTYVEISLDNQYLWYFVDGKLLVETPVVTGDLATRHATQRGFFYIVWMKEDTVLSGPTWSDHVDYWMPFDIPNEIGLHDSSWRDEYGGDIYITDGSHGCVNTPLEAMRTIFETIREGVPVIVY